MSFFVYFLFVIALNAVDKGKNGEKEGVRENEGSNFHYWLISSSNTSVALSLQERGTR